jgi:hypothetical protein
MLYGVLDLPALRIADSAIAALLVGQQHDFSSVVAPNGRHQRSPEGRLDHRDRQREYRRSAEHVFKVGIQAWPTQTFNIEQRSPRFAAGPQLLLATFLF